MVWSNILLFCSSYFVKYLFNISNNDFQDVFLTRFIYKRWFILNFLSILLSWKPSVIPTIYNFWFLFLKVDLHDSNNHLMKIWQHRFDDTRDLETSTQISQHEVYACWIYRIFTVGENLLLNSWVCITHRVPK